jgi:hypothetical protein
VQLYLHVQLLLSGIQVDKLQHSLRPLGEKLPGDDVTVVLCHGEDDLRVAQGASSSVLRASTSQGKPVLVILFVQYL